MMSTLGNVRSLICLVAFESLPLPGHLTEFRPPRISGDIKAETADCTEAALAEVGTATGSRMRRSLVTFVYPVLRISRWDSASKAKGFSVHGRSLSSCMVLRTQLMNS